MTHPKEPCAQQQGDSSLAPRRPWARHRHQQRRPVR